MKESKKQALIGLKKAKTSLENTIDMIENEKYCIDVIQQTLAVI
jgi:DNA-binding FrmR family transcriptional regulator